MTVNPGGWRPERPEAGEGAAATWTGNRALMLEEPLSFEVGSTERTGVDFAPADLAPEVSRNRPVEHALEEVVLNMAKLARSRPIGLPGLSEPEAVRHYTRLSRQNYAIDLGLFPLGSCTMK